MSYQIVGILTLTTHAHQSDPGGKEGNYSGTMKTWHFDKELRRRHIPFITANSVRGLLRRAAAEQVLDTLNKPVSRALFSILNRGAAGRSDIGADPSVNAMIEGSRNVFAGMFGGGPYMIHSRFSIGPLIPVISWTQHYLHPALRSSAVPIDNLTYKREGEVIDAPLTTDIILTGKDDLLMGRGQNHVENYQQSLQNWIEHVQGGRDAKAAAKAAKKDGANKKSEEAPAAVKSSDLQGFNFVEAMLPGTPLQFWLRTKEQTTPAQLGLLLIAVREWANANVVGGMSARGFGRFEAQLALYHGDTEVCSSIFRPGDHATAYRLSPETDQFVQAAEAELKALTIETLEAVYPSNAKAA